MTIHSPGSVLSRIVGKKRERIEQAKARIPFEKLLQTLARKEERGAPDFFHKALKKPAYGDIAVIAEYKRASPSRGSINSHVSPQAMCALYEQGGADALSILTEEDFFGGSLEDLIAVRRQTTLPILRKDFILDRYQIVESALAGADAILLIAAILSAEELQDFSTLATSLGLSVLVEIHTQTELELGLKMGFHLLGINARNLSTFEEDLPLVTQLSQQVPKGRLVVAESAIRTRADVLAVKAAGAQAILVGTSLMTSAAPEQHLRELKGLAAIRRGQANEAKAPSPIVSTVKICGIRDLASAAIALEAGASHLGFIVNYPNSPRHLELSELASLTAAIRAMPNGKKVKLVGVCVDQSEESLLEIAEQGQLDILQLHGDESPALCRSLQEKGVSVWKALRLRHSEDASKCARFEGAVDGLLLDSYVLGKSGGTGIAFDWSWVNQARAACSHWRRPPLWIVSGGLTPANVQDCIEACSPDLLDVSSGVESAPGVKDPARIQSFLAATKLSPL